MAIGARRDEHKTRSDAIGDAARECG